jgi:hypothetical protein
MKKYAGLTIGRAFRIVESPLRARRLLDRLFMLVLVLVGAMHPHARAGWTSVPFQGHFMESSQPITALSWQGQLWAVGGRLGLASSTDGVWWFSAAGSPPNSGTGFSAVIHADRIWSLGGGFLGRNLVYSYDGAAWQLKGYFDEDYGTWYTFITNHTSVSFDGKLWLLGGSYQEDHEEPPPGEGEVPMKNAAAKSPNPTCCGVAEHFLNIVINSPDGVYWTGAAFAPWPARECHASVVFNDRMWVLGGAQSDTWGTLFNDVWYSEDGEQWIQATANAPWCPRAGHAAVVYQDKIWVLGGWAENELKNDVWCSEDGVNWTLVEDQAPWPVRWKHSCTVFEGKLWLLGGYGKPNTWEETKQDIWVYEPDAEGEGEGTPVAVYHTADRNQNQRVDLSELLRVIQFYNLGDFHCAVPTESTEDGYGPGVGDTSCARHDSDYAPLDWRIGLSELLRLIQFFNTGGYTYCPESGTEDGFCPAGQ